MKKTFLFAALLASPALSNAQSIAAGTIAVGGSIGYSRSSSKTSSASNNTTYSNETTSSQFSFSPSVGYFLADNLELGISLGYTANRKPYTTYTPAPAVVRAELDPTTNLRIGPYVRYYKMLTEQFGVSGTLSAGYQNSRDYQYSNSGPNGYIIEYKASGFYADLTPAIVFFPVPKLGLSASIGSIGYNRLNYDYPVAPNSPAPSSYESNSSTFGASFGLSQLLFGGTYYFGR